jgi:hypothetical protein
LFFLKFISEKDIGSPKILVVTVLDKVPNGVTVVTVLEKPAAFFIAVHMITFIPLINVRGGEGKKMLGVVMGQ